MSVLVFSRDPGAANHLVALIERLRDGPDGDAVAPARALLGRGPFAIHARRYAHDVWRRAGIEAADWDQVARDRNADAVIDALAPEAVLTGTSDIDEDTDCALWRAARAAHRPSVCIVDYPTGAAVRFRDRSGPVAPDLVLVPDAACAADLAAAGVAARVHVTGDLHLARLTARGQGTDGRDALRRSWGAAEGDRVVLFASECGREMAAAGRAARYDEIAVLDELIARCAATADAQRTVIVVRPHPRDAAGKYDRVIAPAPLRLAVSAEGAAPQAIGAADEVVGMESTLLLEARALGRKVRSLTGWTRLEETTEGRWTAAS